jgi:hypothetical protein
MTSTITLQRVNHFLLEKQHLLPHAKVESVERIVQDVVGLHATVATTPYLSLLARKADFEKEHLDEALYDRSSLAKLRCVRTTIYVHSHTNLPTVYAATSSLARDASLKYMLGRGIDENNFGKLSHAVLELLADEDLSAAEIRRALDSDLDISALLYHMCDLGLLLRRRPLRSWRDRSFHYGRFDRHYPDIDLHRMTEKEALVGLVRQYLTGFGPALEEDVYWWFGLPKTKLRRALDALERETEGVEIDGLEGTHILLKKQRELLEQNEKGCREIVNFLPMLDSYLMGYQLRRRYLDPRHTKYVFDRSGNATSTILLDGKIIGVWDFEHDNLPCMKLYLFEKMPSDLREKVGAHAACTGAFIAGDDADIRFCASMVPLPQRTAGGFMRPLKDH